MENENYLWWNSDFNFDKYTEVKFLDGKIAFDFMAEDYIKGGEKFLLIYDTFITLMKILLKDRKHRLDNPLYVNVIYLKKCIDKMILPKDIYWDFDIKNESNAVDFCLVKGVRGYWGSDIMSFIGGYFHNDILNIEGVLDLLSYFIVSSSTAVREIYV